jgi:hypothetical protein
MNGFHLNRWELSDVWVYLVLLAPGFLLGTVNFLLVLADRQPKKRIDAWHVLMAVTMLLSLFLVGFELLVLLYIAVIYFFGGGPSLN